MQGLPAKTNVTMKLLLELERYFPLDLFSESDHCHLQWNS